MGVVGPVAALAGADVTVPVRLPAEVGRRRGRTRPPGRLPGAVAVTVLAAALVLIVGRVWVEWFWSIVAAWADTVLRVIRPAAMAMRDLRMSQHPVWLIDADATRAFDQPVAIVQIFRI